MTDERDDSRPGDDQGAEEARPAAEPPEPSEEEKKAKAAAAAKAKAEAAAKAKAEREAAEAAKPAWEKLPETPEIEDAAADPLVAALGRTFGEAIGKATLRAGELAIEIQAAALQEVAKSLKLDHGYTLLVDLCGVHYPDREEAPFEVVYHLFNIKRNHRLRLKVAVAEGVEVPTAIPVWVGANWLEREVYDMYGVRFAGHPDMTRILMWEGFRGHPLRKDFPVEGVETGAAIYPEYYDEEAGPVAGTGTGWKPPEPPTEEQGSE